MPERTAVATIKGYLYQFDDTIIRILRCSPRQSVLIEGIEDVDIESGNTCEAIQCKYLPSRKFSLASIRDAVLPMLSDYLDRIRQSRQEINYRLYAYFSEITPGEIQLDLQSIKQCLIKKKQDGTVINYQDDNHASDDDLERFLNFLSIEIATEYNCHKNKVFEIIKREYSCADAEIEFYYNNALSLVAQMASESEETNRRITKRKFLTKTKTKQILYSIWRLQEVGKAVYCKEMHRQHFSIRHKPAYARIFIIELEGNESQTTIKEAILKLRSNWSSHEKSNRKPQEERHAPYILLNGIGAPQLIELKNELYREEFKFTDGFAFAGASFNVDELNTPQTFGNKLSLRFINEASLIPEIITSLSKTKEIYQFYRTKPIMIADDIKNIQIKIEDITYVKSII